ncbi:MAG TPA: flagellar biosynthesis protein FlgL [Pseudolabrys sp.]|nr:flagellar biosynthesis protein FlgL [Pseudolabrys sp.]
MSVSYIGSMSSTMLQSILDMRSKLDDLQRQLGSGEKSTTYAGLGINTGVSLVMRSQLSALQSYDSTIANVGVRLSVAQQALTGADNLAHTIKTAAVQTDFTINQSGKTGEQTAASNALDQMLGLLNTQAGNRYLFSGSAVDQPSVVSSSVLMNGDATHAGFLQILDQRKQADLGADGLGRLDITRAGASVTVAEDAVSPFGLKISAVNSTLSGATVTGPGGPPASLNVDFTGTPTAGQQVAVDFTLPDGTEQTLTLTATTASPPGDNQFTIGATPTDTATSFEAALNTSIAKIGATTLTAASAMAAADNFFDTDSTHPPQRVDGPPYDSATGLVDGTSANTVQWYTGEDGPNSARTSVSAQIDPSMSVNYGMRANEEGLRNAVKNIAVFAAVSFTANDPNANDAYTALGSRVGAALDGPANQQKITDISAEIAGAQQAFDAAKTRHSQTSNMLTDLLQQVEGVSQDDVGAQILSLQTSLQASLQTTALLSKMSLVNYLSS